jgi:hypothetical protein
MRIWRLRVYSTSTRLHFEVTKHDHDLLRLNLLKRLLSPRLDSRSKPSRLWPRIPVMSELVPLPRLLGIMVFHRLSPITPRPPSLLDPRIPDTNHILVLPSRSSRSSVVQPTCNDPSPLPSCLMIRLSWILVETIPPHQDHELILLLDSLLPTARLSIDRRIRMERGNSRPDHRLLLHDLPEHHLTVFTLTNLDPPLAFKTWTRKHLLSVVPSPLRPRKQHSKLPSDPLEAKDPDTLLLQSAGCNSPRRQIRPLVLDWYQCMRSLLLQGSV